MSLLSPTNLLALTDHYGAWWSALKTACGTAATGPVTGNAQNLCNTALSLIMTSLNDFEQVSDLLQFADNALVNSSVDKATALLIADAINAIDNHCARRGSEVASSIVSLDTYLAYYNGGAGGAIFANMLSYEFGEAYWHVKAKRLSTANQGSSATTTASVMSPGIDPANGNANGMSTCDVSGGYVSGTAVTQSATAGNQSYAEVNLIAEVSSGFSGGSSAPQITVTGTDHNGTTTQTWTGTLGSNNPVAALAGITITPAVTAQARQTVVLSSVTGIVAGSVLTINSGLVDQEKIRVESVNSGASTITAVFLNAHSAGAAVSGSTSIALTPTTAGRRCRSISNIVLTLAGHVSGAVRVNGVQARVAI